MGEGKILTISKMMELIIGLVVDLGYPSEKYYFWQEKGYCIEIESLTVICRGWKNFDPVLKVYFQI